MHLDAIKAFVYLIFHTSPNVIFI